MIKQSFVNSDSILEKKYKILRMCLVLGNTKDKDKTLSDYEKTAREIDHYKKNLYTETLSSKMYPSSSLEEEASRLSELITCIKNRVKERNEFIDDYLKITNNFLEGIDRVEEEDNLDEYQNRLDNINRYLNNVAEIEQINKILLERKKELEEKYENKSNSELINQKLEDELIQEFNKIILNDEELKNIDYLEIEKELSIIDETINDKLEVMNTFISSYEALKNAGISGAEREEYLSYVDDSKTDYYKSLERRYLLKLYSLILTKETDYDKLYQKRENIDNLLNQRISDRRALNVTSKDDLEYFYNICNEQFSIIKSQKYNIENIEKLIEEITNYENRLDEINIDNQKEEIVKLLDEFNLDSPVIDKIEMPKEKEVITPPNIDNTPSKKSNMVIKIKEPTNMNVTLASDTAKLVMKKVVIVLEPKKFGNKRDKLKEAELELERRKQAYLKEKELSKKEEENVIGVDLNRHDVFTDDDADEINQTEEIKINLPDIKEEVIPTEIFIEEDDEKTVDLFKETDPFLDDNEFEIEEKEKKDLTSTLPEIKNIGTVKPNNMINQVEEIVKENDDIILPTMGITNTQNEGVPIVSENYLN